MYLAFITGKILQGNCGAVTYMGDGHYLCGPIPDQPGVDPRASDPINFYARITGKPGETVHLDIQWPEFDEVLAGWQKYKQETFFNVAHDCVYISNDQLEWSRVEDVRPEAETKTLHLTLTLEDTETYVSVNYFYTCRMYQTLRRDLAGNPAVEERIIGRARDGQDMLLYRVTDPAVPVEEKKLVYLQAGQHCCEFGGMHLMDAVLRYLTSGNAADLLKKYEFHILPVFSLADWASGYKDELGADPNTVWDTLCRPENRAVDAYLRSLPQKPVVLLDAHNARKNNFLIISDYVEPERVAAQLRFVELLEEKCDFTKPGTVSRAKEEIYANFKQYGLLNFGYGFTMEISRFHLYERETRRMIPLSKAVFTRFGSQLPRAIDAFISEL